MSFLRVKDKRKRRVSPKDVLHQLQQQSQQRALDAVETMRDDPKQKA
jgi:hypothetical protein